MANSYGRMTSRLLDINIEKLVQSTPVLLWKGYPYDENIQQKVLNKIYNLQYIADYLELPMKELEYTIHSIFFSSLGCCRHNCDNNLCSLQSLFPKKNYTKTPIVLKSDIPLQFKIERLEDAEEDLEITIPYVQYLNKPNLYEAKNIMAYRWYEILPVLSTLQELYKAQNDYLCLDHKYCSFDDSILLRYHNCVDEFGINITKWDQSLRTPISTVREFCRYVIHVESQWLKKEEEKYIERFNKKYSDALQEECKLKKTFYPDLIFKDDDFVQRGSIKWKAIQELKKTEEKPQQVDKKSGKDKNVAKDKGKGSKGGTAPPSQIVLLEKLSKPALPPAHSQPSLHSAKENEPFSFYAYDISNSRVQLTAPTQLLQDDSTSSYFGVYDHYKDVGNVVKDKKSVTHRVSLKMVYEKQHTSNTNIPEPYNDVTENDTTIHAACKSLVPCHTIDDSFTFHHYYEKCDKCLLKAKSEPQSEHKGLPSSKRSKFESDTVVNIPSKGDGTKTSVGTDASIVTSGYPSSSCIQAFSSNMIPTLDVSPESSLLDYCLSEDLATVDANTVVLNKNDYKETESKMVLFSVTSLKEKELELLEQEPYVQRNPDEAVVAIENIVANTKSMPVKLLRKNVMYEPLKPAERECSKTLIPNQSFHECRKCILRLEEDTLNKSDSLSHFKSKSVASLLATLKRTQSDDNFSSTDKERITASLLNIIEDLPIKPHVAKHETSKFISKVFDEDDRTAKGLRPGRSQLILTPTKVPLKRVTRKTVGSQTQPNVQDQNI
ncbi:hypothetical protein ILUMI_20966 [Ignelater luminosus]|uniref:Uncharacterized protein n=1 Tax=Ignelater luminosus TaxID=2038154 RepID=A0A8K0FYF3_IGNLU|nr:hypothetical protein ILUMI_20966 [Ignelater luminosus]